MPGMGIGIAAAPADVGVMKRFFSTRPDRGTAALLATATAFLVVSLLAPADPVTRVNDHGRVISEFLFGWQTILVAALRIACLVCLAFAALRQRDRIELTGHR